MTGRPPLPPLPPRVNLTEALSVCSKEQNRLRQENERLETYLHKTLDSLEKNRRVSEAYSRTTEELMNKFERLSRTTEELMSQFKRLQQENLMLKSELNHQRLKQGGYYTRSPLIQTPPYRHVYHPHPLRYNCREYSASKPIQPRRFTPE